MSVTQLPSITLLATGGQSVSLSEQQGKTVVLYFYPKDNTPGCTLESQQFRDLFLEFKAANAVIFGVSRDSVKSHESFKEKQNLPFDLLADVDSVLCEAFDVIKDKMMYGKSVRGIERSTFVADQSGQICREWRKLKAEGHAAAVLEFVKTL